jgi:hypothetical protein
MSHSGRRRIKSAKSLMSGCFTNVDRNTLNHLWEAIGGWENLLLGVHTRNNRRPAGKLMSRNLKAGAYGKHARFFQAIEVISNDPIDVSLAGLFLRHWLSLQ